MIFQTLYLEVPRSIGKRRTSQEEDLIFHRTLTEGILCNTTTALRIRQTEQPVATKEIRIQIRVRIIIIKDTFWDILRIIDIKVSDIHGRPLQQLVQPWHRHTTVTKSPFHHHLLQRSGRIRPTVQVNLRRSSSPNLGLPFDLRHQVALLKGTIDPPQYFRDLPLNWEPVEVLSLKLRVGFWEQVFFHLWGHRLTGRKNFRRTVTVFQDLDGICHGHSLKIQNRLRLHRGGLAVSWNRHL